MVSLWFGKFVFSPSRNGPASALVEVSTESVSYNKLKTGASISFLISTHCRQTVMKKRNDIE